mgnify:CR=1 FL=1
MNPTFIELTTIYVNNSRLIMWVLPPGTGRASGLNINIIYG